MWSSEILWALSWSDSLVITVFSKVYLKESKVYTKKKAALFDKIKFLNKLSMKSSLPTGSQLKCDRRD